MDRKYICGLDGLRAIAVTWLSWRVIENPFLRMKRFFPAHMTDNNEVAAKSIASPRLEPLRGVWFSRGQFLD